MAGLKADIWTSNKARFLLPAFFCTHIHKNGQGPLYAFRVARRGGEKHSLTMFLTLCSSYQNFYQSKIGLSWGKVREIFGWRVFFNLAVNAWIAAASLICPIPGQHFHLLRGRPQGAYASFFHIWLNDAEWGWVNNGKRISWHEDYSQAHFPVWPHLLTCSNLQPWPSLGTRIFGIISWQPYIY